MMEESFFFQLTLLYICYFVQVVVEIGVAGTEVASEQSGVRGEDSCHLDVPETK